MVRTIDIWGSLDGQRLEHPPYEFLFVRPIVIGALIRRAILGTGVGDGLAIGLSAGELDDIFGESTGFERTRTRAGHSGSRRREAVSGSDVAGEGDGGDHISAPEHDYARSRSGVQNTPKHGNVAHCNASRSFFRLCGDGSGPCRSPFFFVSTNGAPVTTARTQPRIYIDSA